MIHKLMIDDICIRQLQHYRNIVIPTSLYLRFGEKQIIEYFLNEKNLNVKLEVIRHEGTAHEAWPYCDGIKRATKRKSDKMDITAIIHLIHSEGEE